MGIYFRKLSCVLLITAMMSLSFQALAQAPASLSVPKTNGSGVQQRLDAIRYLDSTRSTDAVRALTKFLQDPAPEVRGAAILALGRMGPAAQTIVPELTKALEDKDAGVRGKSASALGSIHTGAETAVPALTLALKDPDLGVRNTAAGALGRFGAKAASAVPALAELIHKEPEQYVREGVADALGNLGVAAVPALIDALVDKRPGVRTRAALALGAIGPAAKEAIPALMKAEQMDPVATMRGFASVALKQIKG
ncbi:HEAT repeat domain-containing protein [Anthocerotibacter panamensis]|uniref:HEAT repeat domain-containing protein n=1 Tax=Anthocerotibacter panamensis TaxID=2857077 RepID=UPI001C405C8A|nr:HEAT repeat domain-containing protein [Anthocerotibacter panamensis]